MKANDGSNQKIKNGKGYRDVRMVGDEYLSFVSDASMVG